MSASSWGVPPRSIGPGDDLAAVDAVQRPERREVDAVGDELHGAVAEDEVGPAGVPAAEAPGVLALLVGHAVAGPVGVVDVELVVGHVAVYRGVGAGPPVGPVAAVGVQLLGLADEDGVAGAVGDVAEPGGAVGAEGAGQAGGGVARRVVGVVQGGEQVVAAAGVL